MKFLRVGNLGAEKPAILDNGIIRDLSSVIKDIDRTTIGDDLISTIKKLDISKLPQLNNNLRIGASVSNPSNFLGIGLNFLDHALEQNLELPKEPIIFSKVIALVYLLNKTHRVLARICTAPCRWASGLELAVRLGENSEKSVP